MPAVQDSVRTDSRSQDWHRLAALIESVKNRGLAGLSEQELWELPGLYRRAMSDLSLLRSQRTSPHLEQELSQLCNSAHAIVYRGTIHQRSKGLIDYIFCEIPRSVRRRSRYVLAAAAIMSLFAVLGWFHAEINPTLAESVLSPRLVSGIHTSLEAAREESDLGLAAQIPYKDRIDAWLQITLNNIGVSVRAFLFGLAGGVLTLFIIAFNGYMLGVVAHLYCTVNPGFPINLPLYFFAGIAPHGSIELPAICLAGGAGMLLGFSWLFPGQLTRGESLRNVGPDAGRITLACALTLIVAGILEGFVTPLLSPIGMPEDLWFWFKIIIGVVVFSGWLTWLLLGGRTNSSTGAQVQAVRS